MPTFLERYHAGKREQVWAELVALGKKVREEPFYSDAWAVAQETMRRVKANIETLYERLKAIGYAFQSPRYAHVPPEPGIAAQIEAFEREVGPLPLSLRAWLEIVGGVDFNGNYPGLCYDGRLESPSVQIIRKRSGLVVSEEGRELINRVPDPPGVGGIIMRLMRDRLTKAPLGTNLDDVFFGDTDNIFATLLRGMNGQSTEEEKRRSTLRNQFGSDLVRLHADPLVVWINPDELSAEYYHEWQDEINEAGESVSFALCFAPDVDMKANTSGSIYEIDVLSPNADAYLYGEEHDTLFVNYLRICFRWGGFPGLEHEEGRRNEAVLKMLTEGLLEI